MVRRLKSPLLGTVAVTSAKRTRFPKIRGSLMCMHSIGDEPLNNIYPTKNRRRQDSPPPVYCRQRHCIARNETKLDSDVKLQANDTCPSAWRYPTTCSLTPSTSTLTRRPRALRDQTRLARANASLLVSDSSPVARRTASTTNGATVPWESCSRVSSTSRPPGQAREGRRAEEAWRRWPITGSELPGTQLSLCTTPAVSRQELPYGQPAQTSLSTPQRSAPRRKRPKPEFAHFPPQEFLKVQKGSPEARSMPQPTSSMQWPPMLGEPSVLLKMPLGCSLKNKMKFA
mmetsp:Transcript_104467/g.300290  ORF Transcript_104467/g.300290 Transcript_104467/m.300290 type:complete len:286 (-) Transcript_104467:700-1557(-)